MKNKIILISIFVLTLISLSNAQTLDQVDLKHELILKLFNAPELSSVKSNGKLIIIETEYCKDFDCKSYFNDYQEQIKIYSKQEAFIRLIKDYLEIERIDTKSGQIKLRKREGKEYQSIQIKL